MSRPRSVGVEPADIQPDRLGTLEDITTTICQRLAELERQLGRTRDLSLEELEASLAEAVDVVAVEDALLGIAVGDRVAVHLSVGGLWGAVVTSVGADRVRVLLDVGGAELELDYDRVAPAPRSCR